MNWIDIAIVAILLLGIITGIKKGFLMSVSNIVSMLVAILVAKNYYNKLTIFLVDKTALEEKIMKILLEKNFLEKFTLGMPTGIAPAFSTEEFVQNIHYFITILIINAISIIAIYFAVRLVLSIAEGFMKGAAELPGLKELNGVGGGAIGFAKSVIILLIMFALIIPVSNIQTWTFLRDGLDNSMLAKYFYSYNFVLNWIWNSAFNLFKGNF